MTESLLTSLSMERPSTLLSMETSSLHHGEQEECEVQGQAMVQGRPPDINLPLAVELMSNGTGQWGTGAAKLSVPIPEAQHSLEVSLAPSNCHDSPGGITPSKGRRWNRRGDTIWGAWFFFNHYFRPALTDKCLGKMTVEKSDLRLDQFLVQHDMENMYMWTFKERPENALGKMQLRSYMNGHARFGEPQFPFSVDKGFSRSHRMQRKHYRGLSNPQCVHGVEVVRDPCLDAVTDEERKRWMELTGRDSNFIIPPDAEAFSEWRNMNNSSEVMDYDGRSPGVNKAVGTNGIPNRKTPPPPTRNSKPQMDTLNLTKVLASHNSNSNNHHQNNNNNNNHNSNDDFSGGSKKRKKGVVVSNWPDLDPSSLSYSGGEDTEQTSAPPWWLSNFNGVMSHASGPVTAAKSVYEDDKGYFIMVSLPFVDMNRLRVSWMNTATNGVVKLHCVSTARAPLLTRGERTFKLTDPSPEHCPPGEFVREIVLSTRIPENADLKAFYVPACAGLEIMVPKHKVYSEEREVRVFLPPQMNHSNEQLLSCHPSL